MVATQVHVYAVIYIPVLNGASMQIIDTDLLDCDLLHIQGPARWHVYGIPFYEFGHMSIFTQILFNGAEVFYVENGLKHTQGPDTVCG